MAFIFNFSRLYFILDWNYSYLDINHGTLLKKMQLIKKIWYNRFPRADIFNIVAPSVSTWYFGECTSVVFLQILFITRWPRKHTPSKFRILLHVNMRKQVRIYFFIPLRREFTANKYETVIWYFTYPYKHVEYGLSKVTHQCESQNSERSR